MKKISLYASVAAFLLLSLLLSACGVQEKPSSKQSDSTHPTSSDIKAIPDSESPEPSVLRFLTSAEDFTTQTVGTENGFYYIDRNQNLRVPNANLRYIDYATAQDIYLSARPEANHLTPEDDSYISSVAGQGEVFPDGNDLFLLRVGMGGASKEQLAPDLLPAVFRMNLDGTDRKQIYSGSASEMLTTAAAVDDTYLYLVSRRVEMVDGMPENRACLMQMDRVTGKTKDLCEIYSSARMIGAADGLLLFQQRSSESPEGLNWNYEIFAYEPATGRLSVIQTWTQADQALAIVYQEHIITASLTAHTVTIRNVRTGEALAAWPLPDSLPEDISGFPFGSCYDGRFLFWDYAAEKLHVLNLTTGEWGDMRLSYIDPVKNDLRPVRIWAENSSHFLVCYDNQLVIRRYWNPDDGVPYEAECYAPCYALIPKEDYWNSEPNYQLVTFNG